MPHQSRTAERIIDAIASQAHGWATREELLGAGLSEDQIRSRICSGLLVADHPGVYRVGHHSPSVEATYMGAVKAGGRGALLAELPAAHLLELIRSRTTLPPVVVTATERRIAGGADDPRPPHRRGRPVAPPRHPRHLPRSHARRHRPAARPGRSRPRLP